MKKSFLVIFAAIFFAFAVIFSCAATWNHDKPAIGDQISEDIPDIEENFQTLHDVLENITNKELGTDEPGTFEVDNVNAAHFHGSMMTYLKGHVSRARFAWKDTDEIYLYAGTYEANGKLCYWHTVLTEQIASPDASSWYYIYLDDSEITSGTAITATEIISSKTAPSWSDAKHGWYNGNDRCIFAVYSDSGSNIIEYFHEGNSVIYANKIIDADDVQYTHNTWTDVTLTIPAFARLGLVTFELNYEGLTFNLWWRTNGQTGTTGHHVAQGTNEMDYVYNDCMVFTDTSQKIEVKIAAENITNRASTFTNGWQFPNGM